MPNPNKEYRLSPRASGDLEAIWLYSLETWSMDQADTYHMQIVARLERLALGELRGTDCDYIRQGYFKLAVGSHLAFYREAPYGFEVVRILHQSMDFERHL
jgi:toxin ParE1/3/4